MNNNYAKFAAMIATSTLVMFALMYLNTYALDHIFFSETRAYMALYMGAVMAIIMLAFMLGMYANKGVNVGHLPWERGGLRRRALAGAQPSHRGRGFLDEGDDPTPLDRHSHE